MPKILGPYPVRVLVAGDDGGTHMLPRTFPRAGSATAAKAIARRAGYSVSRQRPPQLVRTPRGPEWHITASLNP
jgi:hypothetical protein